VYYATAGENIKVKVKGIDEKEIERGNIICSTDDLCPIT
jgi:translation elongation factor EF-1alpha